jgi:sugar phosphate isomerase/epimerase
MSSPDLLATCWTSAGDAVPLDGRDDSPIDLTTRIEVAGRSGFTGFGLVHNDLAIYLREHDLPTLRKTFADNGIRHVELEFLTGWWEPEGTRLREESDAVLDLLVRAAGELNPHHIKVGPDITGGPFDLETYAANWYRISEAFARVGSTIAIEFMPFSNVPTVTAASELVAAAGHPAGGLMVDLWHIMRGPGTLDELAALPLEHITGVELDDGGPEQIGDGYTDTVLHRMIPGQGVWDVPAFIRILQDKGWTGPWGVEILSETYRVRPIEEAMPEVYRDTMRQFELAGAVAR